MRRTNAFTLIELLVVISIIAILVALLLPALSKARNAAESAKCLANFHSVGPALVAYVTDHDGMMPPYYEFGTDSDGATLPDGFYTQYRRHLLFSSWFKSGSSEGGPRGGDGFLGPYMNSTSRKMNEAVMSCPSVEDALGFQSVWAGGPVTINVFKYHSFAFNVWNLTNFRIDGNGAALNYDQMDRPSQLYLVVDGAGAQPYIQTPDTLQPAEDYSVLTPNERHNSAFNGAFLDGHADSSTNEERWTEQYFVPQVWLP